MRTVRVLLRSKSRLSDLNQSVKVVTNCRIPGRKKPVQIHLGYLSLMFVGRIPQGQRSKLLKNLRRKWVSYFQTEQVDVDWADAERKLDLLRAQQADTFDTVQVSARPTLDVDRRHEDARSPQHRSRKSSAAQAAPAAREQLDPGA